MDANIREQIKQSLKSSILAYVSGFEYTSKQPLDLLIPKERKIRSIVGGLETSMGTRIWEPIAKTLAENNGFEIVNEKILKPEPLPEEFAMELSRVITLRENKVTWINAKECVDRLRLVVSELSIDRSEITYVPPAAGTGVDIRIRKNGQEFAFDIKTVQPNLSSIKSFNKQILEWCAYSIFRQPDIDITCRIAYPYNPHSNNFWTHTPHTSGVLEPSIDAVVENEFWDFLSGYENTYQEIESCLTELNDEGFGEQISSIIENMR